MPVDLLIITHESIGDRMAGPSIRSWEIAQALGKYGLQIQIATPYPSTRTAVNVDVVMFDWHDPAQLSRYIDDARVVMGIGTVLARVIALFGRPISKPTIVDTYYVPEIEQILLNLTTHKRAFDPTPIFVNELSTYLRQADYVLVATEHQFDFWLGALLSFGRINSHTLKNFNVDHLIGSVPLGIPDAAPDDQIGDALQAHFAQIAPTDKIVYWGGGIWDWTDPNMLLDAMSVIWQKRNDVILVFGSLNHYDQRIVPEMSEAARVMERVKAENWLGSKVFFGDWVPYDLRAAVLMRADVGVGLTKRTIENRYAVRARILDYIWTGLPCVLSDGDEYAAWAAELGVAKLVSPGDVDGLVNALIEQLNVPITRTQRLDQLHPLIAHRRWSAAVKPLLAFLRQPALAPDATIARAGIGESVSLRLEIESLRRERDSQVAHWAGEFHRIRDAFDLAQREFEAFKQRPFIKLGDKIGRTLWQLTQKFTQHD